MADILVTWPNFLGRTAQTYASFNMNGSDVLVAVYMAEEDATIDEIGWYLQTKTGTPVGQVRVGIQSVSTTDGRHTGTWLGGSGSNYVTYGTNWSTINVGALNATLLNTVSLTRGQYYAVVFEPVVAFDTSNFITIGYSHNTVIGANSNIPYVYTGTLLTNRVARRPNFAIRSSTKTYGFPFTTMSSYAIDSDIFNEIGHYFVIPSAMCATYKVSGIELAWTPNTAGNDFDIILYEGTNRTALQSRTVFTDCTEAAGGVGFLYFDESTLSTLSAGTGYRLMIKPNTTLTSGTLYRFDVDQAQDLTAYIGSDATSYLTQWSGTAYTDTTTQFLAMNLIISDITEPTGGGGAYPVFGGMVIQ